MGNPLFSPSHVLPHHASDQLANFLGQLWPPTPRLPTPIQLETLAMPADESRRGDDGERLLPVEEPRPEHQR